jgi:choline dehydrogenase-like flavoprotein
VVDRFWRFHDAQNVFLIDSSIFPTGFGLNPMVTVMANAVRLVAGSSSNRSPEKVLARPSSYRRAAF